MPTFCRHNRFIERCPICSKTLPGQQAPSGSARRPIAAGPSAGTGRRRGGGSQRVRIQREGRAQDDGYRSPLVPGLRASADASRLAAEMAFASGRLAGLREDPPGLYGEIRRLAGDDPERATWACFLTAYLSPLDGEDPFAGIRLALAAGPSPPLAGAAGERPAAVPDLGGIPLGPRSSHDPGRGGETLVAYGQWVQRAARSQSVLTSGAGAATDGPQAIAFRGDPSWSATRRFERIFERLALPGFGRAGRYDLLVTLGYLGVYELRPDALHLGGARGVSAEDPTRLGAKRVFGIGDPLVLERRAAALAEAASAPVETLDLALSNWASPERATLGFPPDSGDPDALALAEQALGL
ncbi:MAG TPA: hypothetical protein VGN08_07425 [Solirubrobacteraceae bacterium]|jgi:hypothetical protein